LPLEPSESAVKRSESPLDPSADKERPLEIDTFPPDEAPAEPTPPDKVTSPPASPAPPAASIEPPTPLSLFPTDNTIDPEEDDEAPVEIKTEPLLAASADTKVTPPLPALPLEPLDNRRDPPSPVTEEPDSTTAAPPTPEP
jgi:hypothetical protein